MDVVDRQPKTQLAYLQGSEYLAQSYVSLAQLSSSLFLLLLLFILFLLLLLMLLKMWLIKAHLRLLESSIVFFVFVPLLVVSNNIILSFGQ